MIEPYNDEYFMKAAFRMAQEAEKSGEIPVGAVVVAGNQIIGKGYNQTESLRDSTAHAEMIALTAAFQYLGAKYLHECRIYVTLEPCVMCAGALHWSQIDQIIIGAKDLKKGYSLFNGPGGAQIIHPKTKIKTGVLGDSCSSIIEEFFKKIRE